MTNIPDDIYTEPENSPDTLANLGPLTRLAGTWASDQGVDLMFDRLTTTTGGVAYVRRVPGKVAVGLR